MRIELNNPTTVPPAPPNEDTGPLPDILPASVYTVVNSTTGSGTLSLNAQHPHIQATLRRVFDFIELHLVLVLVLVLPTAGGVAVTGIAAGAEEWSFFIVPVLPVVWRHRECRR